MVDPNHPIAAAIWNDCHDRRMFDGVDADIRDEIASEWDRIAALEEAEAWTDDDKPLPEDAEIKATHPAHCGANFDEDVRAMKLVGAKRSKSGLVNLVRWLLVENRKAKAGPTREEIETTIGEALRECVLGNPKTRAQILADAMSRLYPTAPVDEENNDDS